MNDYQIKVIEDVFGDPMNSDIEFYFTMSDEDKNTSTEEKEEADTESIEKKSKEETPADDTSDEELVGTVAASPDDKPSEPSEVEDVAVEEAPEDIEDEAVEKVWSLPLTDKLKQASKDGMPYYVALPPLVMGAAAQRSDAQRQQSKSDAQAILAN